MLQKRTPDWFHDIRVANEMTSNHTYKTTLGHFKEILSQHNFRAYCDLIQKSTRPYMGKSKHDKPIIPTVVRRGQRFLPIEEPTIPFNAEAATVQLNEMESHLKVFS